MLEWQAHHALIASWLWRCSDIVMSFGSEVSSVLVTCSVSQAMLCSYWALAQSSILAMHKSVIKLRISKQLTLHAPSTLGCPKKALLLRSSWQANLRLPAVLETRWPKMAPSLWDLVPPGHPEFIQWPPSLGSKLQNCRTEPIACSLESPWWDKQTLYAPKCSVYLIFLEFSQEKEPLSLPFFWKIIRYMICIIWKRI